MKIRPQTIVPSKVMEVIDKNGPPTMILYIFEQATVIKGQRCIKKRALCSKNPQFGLAGF